MRRISVCAFYKEIGCQNGKLCVVKQNRYLIIFKIKFMSTLQDTPGSRLGCPVRYS